MPPPVELSEEESGGESIGFGAPQNDAGKDAAMNNGEAEEQSDSEEDEDVYVVEKVVGHKWQAGILRLKVKWKGYEAEKDHTMEPEEHLIEGAKDVLDEYYTQIGGRPEKPGKKRKSTGSATGETPAKKSRKSEEATPEEGASEFETWFPKGKNWEKDVLSVDTIIRDEEEDNKLYGCVTWTNKKKAKVPLRQCYDKFPLKMLQFYEQHLVFKNT